jgi:hypothetical protein
LLGASAARSPNNKSWNQNARLSFSCERPGARRVFEPDIGFLSWCVMSEIDYGKEIRQAGVEQRESASFYYRCPVCGDLIDWRDLDALVLHVGPLPHPVEQ